MLHSPLGCWHVRLCERVYVRFFDKFYPSLPMWSGYAFEFLVGGLLLEGLVTWRDNPKGGERPSL